MTQLLLRVEKLKLLDGLDLVKNWADSIDGGKQGLWDSAMDLVSDGSLWAVMLLRVAIENGKTQKTMEGKRTSNMKNENVKRHHLKIIYSY